MLFLELRELVTNVDIVLESTESVLCEIASSKSIDLSTIECAFFHSEIARPINWNELMREVRLGRLRSEKEYLWRLARECHAKEDKEIRRFAAVPHCR